MAERTQPMTTDTIEETQPPLDDLLSDQAVNDPRTYFKRLRDADPVYWNARWNGWVVTSYADVAAGYRDHERLSSDRFRGPFARDILASRSAYASLIEFMTKWMFTSDRPYHTHLRSLVNKAFTPSTVEVLRPRVRELVRSLAAPLAGQERVNFLADFAFPLPVIVIAEYLGLPPESRDEVKAWSDDLGAVIFVQGNNANRFAVAEQAMNNLVGLIRPIVRARAREPRQDLISAMVHTEVDGDRFTEEEIVANAVLMVFAGHDTTMNLLANGIVAFSAFPDQWDRLGCDPGLARTATEEILRYDGPIKALARWAREPFELGGKHVGQNDRVLLVMHAANHDPAFFDRPDLLDVARWPNRHLEFGQGIHTCLGAPLARLEAQETFAHLAKTFGSVQVLTKDLSYDPTVVSRSPRHLEVRLQQR
jgi:cytochrome P450